jgi:GTPase
LGVEDALTKLGAERGAAVTIGEVTFDFEPAGSEEYVPTRRGYDERLQTSTRNRADDRLLAKKARRVRSGDDVEYLDDGLADDVGDAARGDAYDAGEDSANELDAEKS